MDIRKYKETDIEEIADLFYDTVHHINTKHYTEEQVNAWASGNIDKGAWNRSFLEHYSIVVVEKGILLGFGDVDNTGYLDRLFVHKDFQGKGVATCICNELEKHIRERGVRKMVTHASITARPFFEKFGFRVIKEQQVERKGILLTNFIMEKPL
jgi:putative acetyltransferase